MKTRPDHPRRPRTAAPVAARRAAGGLIALAVALAWAQPAGAESPSDREPPGDPVVRYEMDAWLDHAQRTVQGRGRITWRNTSADLIGELQLHLYMNAFKNTRTTFMRESKGRHRTQELKEGHWGWIDLLSLKLEDGTDLLPVSAFIQPDDGNEDDETVVRVPLEEWLEPGREIALEMVFSTRLPKVFARTGYSRDFYLVAQWFPKMCVYEGEGTRGREVGGWNCHQFHSNSEFYADFGSYDVSITVPEEFVVGATGRQAGPPEASPGGAMTYRFVQDRVHDFAWTADPDFIETTRTFSFAARRDPGEERRMARVLGLDASGIPGKGAADLSGVPEELRLPDVEVTLLIQPEHEHLIDRHFRAVDSAILYYGYWYGAYPYETLTVVDPAWDGRGAGGMEYPTFFTAGARYIAPDWRHEPESVIIHEYGHQYWYGLVASNEFEEAWLDEGLNTFATGRVLEKVYGPNHEYLRVNGLPIKRFPFFRIPRDADPNSSESVSKVPGGGSGRMERLAYLRWAGASNEPLLNLFRDLPFLTQPSDVPVPFFENRRMRYIRDAAGRDDLARPSWEFLDRPSYGSNVYSKTAVMLDSLRTLIGEEKFDRGMRLYHQRWRFRHPATADFIEAMSEGAGEDLSWFLDQLVHGSDLLDYRISEARSEPLPPAAGAFGPATDREEITREEARERREEAEGDPDLETVVTARRLGGVRVPMEIVLEYEGGRRQVVPWDGEYRWHRVREIGPDRLLRARVGPPEPISLEATRTDNTRSVESDPWPALKWWTRMVGWIQNVLHFYAGIS